MSSLLKLLISLTLFFPANYAIAKHSLIAATVYCSFPKPNHFNAAPGATLEIRCKKIRKQVRTDNGGEFKVVLPASRIRGCSIRLIRSSNCGVISSSSSVLPLKSSTKQVLLFKPNSAKTDQIPFVPTIPFLPPPSILPPNPLQPPPSIIPPIFPTPPPSIFPPVLPTPPSPPFFPLPSIPGLIPSPPPPPPPILPIPFPPFPPFPFQPTPGFPGVPPAKASTTTSP